MKARILISAILSLAAMVGAAQSIDNTISVKQFAGTTVGQKVAAAELTCGTATAVKCYLLLDPSLAAYATGTIPTLCSHCVLVDYRTGWPGGAPGINQLTGDVLAGPGSGSQAAALKVSNSAPGSCGDSTHVCVIVTNSKGLTTSQTPVAISGGGGGGSSSVTVTQAPNLIGSRCFSGVTNPDTTPPTSPCVFQNTSSTAMFVVVSGDLGGGGFHADAYSDASATPTTLIAQFGRVNAGSSSPNFYPNGVGFFVPAGNYYGVSATNGSGTVIIKSWTEYSLSAAGGGGSVGTAGQMQMAGSTSGTFAASACTDNGVKVACTEQLSAPSVVAGAPTSAALAALPSGAHGTAMDETSTAGVPAAGVDYLRADSVTHQILYSQNGGLETGLATPSALWSVTTPTVTCFGGTPSNVTASLSTGTDGGKTRYLSLTVNRP